MKLLSLKLLLLLGLAFSVKAGLTNTTLTAVQITNLLTANLSNSIYSSSNMTWTASNANYSLYVINSNILYSLTNYSYSSNLAVLTPGSNVTYLKITNNTVKGVSATP